MDNFLGFPDMSDGAADWIVMICCALMGAMLWHLWLINHPKTLIGTAVGRNFERELNGWNHA